MNLLVETLNAWADHALGFAWPMLWQSSLLIGVLFVLDLVLRRKLRPAVRYALWLVVLVKLLLPPSLAFPTSAGWWLRSSKVSLAGGASAPLVVTYDIHDLPVAPIMITPGFAAPPPPRFSAGAWMLICAAVVSLGLLMWMLVRWRQVVRGASRAAEAPGWLNDLLPELPCPARFRLTDHSQSPAVCGLLQPVILLPRLLVGQLPPAQMRAVLLHELFHLRRGDVWVNCAQALLQIVYWWHPLLWFANARIRRVREEAVDDAVMLALNEDAETYAPTLLEVAKLALHRPLASLGLVGILESRSALRQRIERLMDFRPPRKAGLTLGSGLVVLGFAALAVPMGGAPAPTPAAALPESRGVTSGIISQTSSNAALPLDHSQLYNRTFKVDTNVLFESLALTKGPVGTNSAMALTDALRELFARAGVDLDPTSSPGKASYYNETRSMLIVRGTRQDLEAIEGVIAMLNTAPPQINIKAKFVEVSQEDTEALGLNGDLHSVVSTNSPTGGQVGTAFSSSDVPTGASSAGGFPGNPSAGTNGPIFTHSGILMDTQFRMVIKALQQRQGTELLAQPEVTTTSGRQAQCKAVDVRSIIQRIDERALTPPGIMSTNKDGDFVYKVEEMEFGPVLDITPSILTDGYTVNMSLVASMLGFLGYEDNQTNRVTVYVNGERKQVSLPQPVFRMAQIVSQVNVRDGQTVVLAGPFSCGESRNAQKRELLVFITPTIIDSAGNRVHPVERAPSGVPAQPSR